MFCSSFRHSQELVACPYPEPEPSVLNLMLFFRCLRRTKQAVQVQDVVKCFVTTQFFMARCCLHLAQTPSCGTTSSRLSATAYLIYLRHSVVTKDPLVTVLILLMIIIFTSSSGFIPDVLASRLSHSLSLVPDIPLFVIYIFGRPLYYTCTLPFSLVRLRVHGR